MNIFQQHFDLTGHYPFAAVHRVIGGVNVGLLYEPQPDCVIFYAGLRQIDIGSAFGCTVLLDVKLQCAYSGSFGSLGAAAECRHSIDQLDKMRIILIDHKSGILCRSSRNGRCLKLGLYGPVSVGALQHNIGAIVGSTVYIAACSNNLQMPVGYR